jgi:nicotinamidase-related amidase
MDERHGLAVPRTLEDALEDPRRVALLVYDMQVGILSQLADGDRVLAQVLEVLAAARAARLRTIFARHITLPTELMGVSQLRMWRSWQRVSTAREVSSVFRPNAPHTQLVSELAPAPHEAVLDKITMSAFEGTWLDIALRDCGVTTIVVVGVALEIGVEPTVRHAADLGYIPVVISDACGAGDPAAGERAWETLRFLGDALVTDVDGFRNALPARASTSPASDATSAGH